MQETPTGALTHERTHTRTRMAHKLSTQANPAVVKQALDRVQIDVGGEITPAAIRSLGYERLKRLVERVHRNKQKASRILEAAVRATHRNCIDDVLVHNARCPLMRDCALLGS